MNESNIDNALMAQKDCILDLLNEIENNHPIDLDNVNHVLLLLKYSVRLWNSARYGYKGLELVGRLQSILRSETQMCTNRYRKGKLFLAQDDSIGLGFLSAGDTAKAGF